MSFRRGAARATAGAVMLAVGLAGCAGEPGKIAWPDDPTPVEPANSRSPMVDPAEAAATKEILAVVHEYRRVQTESYAAPQPPHVARRQLAAYLADPLLSQTLGTLDTMLRAGVVFEGRPGWDPVVEEVRLDATPPTATIRDCVDANGWTSVFEVSGNPVPSDHLPDRYVVRLNAKRYPDGWLLHDAALEEVTQC